MKLSELLGLPDGLSDKERGACIALANHYGAEYAQDEASKILAKRQDANCSSDDCARKIYDATAKKVNNGS